MKGRMLSELRSLIVCRYNSAKVENQPFFQSPAAIEKGAISQATFVDGLHC